MPEMLIATDFTVEDGELVWVRSEKALFVYEINSGLTPDNVDIFRPDYGNGVWVRTNLARGPQLGAEAIMSFDATASFPLAGPSPVFNVVPRPQLFGVTFVGFSQPFPGILQVEFALNRPMDAAVRVELTGVALTGIGPLDPFVPIAIVLSATGTQFLQAVIANNPTQPPGSPDITIEFHTTLTRVPPAAF